MDLPWIEVELPLECLSISSVFMFVYFEDNIDKRMNKKKMKQKIGIINSLK